MSEKVLSQKEIDQLFARYAEAPIKEEASDLLTRQELDTVGELGNICMGNAATILSELLNHRVTIGYPKTIVCMQDEVFQSFLTPYLIIEVKFKRGLNGFNVLVISEEEVAAIADVMMGGTGDVQKPIQIGEMELSATTEAMNQMIGASATAMAELFGVPIDIEPPKTTLVEDLINATHTPLPTDRPVVVARFEITIGDLIKTTFMQITNVDAAREQTNFLLMKAGLFAGDDEGTVVDNSLVTPSDDNKSLPNLSGALNLPLDMIFSLAKKRCSVKDVANLKIGDEIKLGTAKEVEIMVNGQPVALGELNINGEDTTIKIKQLY